MSTRDLAALDAYLAALESMENAVGAQARAVAAADKAGLPPLELALAGSALRAAQAGHSARDFLVARLHLTDHPPLAQAAHSHTANRLYQAVANLRGAGLWPWEGEG